MPSTPVIKQQLSDILATENDNDTVLNLLDYFDDPRTTGLVATFTLSDSSLGNSGVSEVVLYDQAGLGAPLSVANFLNYVDAQAYNNTFIHRSVENFIIQGGRSTVVAGANGSGLSISDIDSNGTVQNEFSADRPNSLGTIAFAKPRDQPDGATKEWFFNVGDNTNILDESNTGGFSVFGEVRSPQDLEAINAIGNLSIFKFPSVRYRELPLITDRLPNSDPTVFDIPPETVDEFVRYESITVAQQAELSFEVIENSNPALVTPIISGSQLTLDYADNQIGSATLRFRATNLQGEIVEDSVTVTLKADDLLDFNNDRNSDFLWHNSITGEAATWFMNGSTYIASQELGTVSTDWQLVDASDFNNDGNSDLLWHNSITGEAVSWYMNGGNYIGGDSLGAASTDWQLVGASDLNNDGNSDLLWHNSITGEAVSWYMNGGTYVGGQELGAVFTDWQLVDTSDFNNDAHLDLLWQNNLTGQVVTWYMDGGIPVSSQELGVAPTEWQLMGASDLNGDRNSDLLWQNSITGEAVTWYMNGSSFAGSQGLGTVPTDWQLVG